MKLLLALALFLSAVVGAAAQPPAAAPIPGPAPVASPAPAPAPAPVKLSLPAPSTVPATRALLKILATTDAPEVAWSVFFVDGQPVEFLANDKTLYLPVPDPGVTILISAFVAPGQVAQTTVTVDKPAPAPAPTKTVPAIGKLYVVMVYDKSAVTPEAAAVLNSAKVRAAVETTGGKVRIVASNDPFIVAKGLGEVVAKTGLPCLIVQDAAGQERHAQALPASEAEALALIRQLHG